MLQRSLYRSLLRSARELQEAAAVVSADPCDELRKFFSPAQLLTSAPRARGGELVAAVRRQFALHRSYGADEADELINAGFRAMRQAGTRTAQLRSEGWAPRAARWPAVRYATGDCVLHRKYGYRGVIVGWDDECEQSDEWVSAMRVEELEQGSRQPFYHVLVDTRDRSPPQVCYVAQENVDRVGDVAAEPLEDGGADAEPSAASLRLPIQHPEIESYMTCFVPSENRYVPNEELRAMYPED